MLTPRQRAAYDLIRSFSERNGFAPSFDEIRRHLRLASLNSVAKLIAQLRLPDANGVKPHSKGGNPGGIRAPYKTSGISALEAAQQRRAS